MGPMAALIVIIGLVIACLIYSQVRNSPGLNKFIKNITETEDIKPPTPDDYIKDISEAERSLIDQQKAAEKEAEDAKEKSAKIGDYLAKNKPVAKTDDPGKEDSDKKY